MDMKLFLRSLSKTQDSAKRISNKSLNEDAYDREADSALNNANKFLDKAYNDLEEAISYVEDFIDVGYSSTSRPYAAEDKKNAKQTLKQLNVLFAQLKKVSDTLPVAGSSRRK